MEKYKQLVADYAGLIGQIKEYQRQKEELKRELRALSPEDYDYVDIAEQFAYVDEQEQEARAHLDYAIKDEYAGVPFRQSRNQGISAFYREAGLNPS